MANPNAAGRDPKLRPRGEEALLDRFLSEFHSLTSLRPSFDAQYADALGDLVSFLAGRQILPLAERRQRFLGLVNRKFRLNAKAFRNLYAIAAKMGITFNFPQKKQIQDSFDLNDRGLFIAALEAKRLENHSSRALLNAFAPLDAEASIRYLQGEVDAPSQLRREVGARDIAGEIVKGLFAAFMWVAADEETLHEHFDPEYDAATYDASFWCQLQSRTPLLFNRDHALHCLKIGADTLPLTTYETLRSTVTSWVQASYADLNNYGYLAVAIEPLVLDRRNVQWELAADLMLYAEKHRQVSLKNSYFRPDVVREATTAYVRDLDVDRAAFEVINEGFSYRDCFVLGESADEGELALLLVFQKNERDETLVPCPRCRSHDVAGNSYPSLGVRSWECRNPLCPDRSKYNRGKRYSFRGMAMQQAIEDPRNTIPVASARRWSRDVVMGITPAEALEMTIRHYSMAGDTVHAFGWGSYVPSVHDRVVIGHAPPAATSDADGFWNSAFFYRYLTAPSAGHPHAVRNLGTDTGQVLVGDSGQVLGMTPENTYDLAVTSPPYYNARDYSQWPNVYCYLHDMLTVARQVFRTLKPGAEYWFNIFDYFDNENVVVQSAMERSG